MDPATLGLAELLMVFGGVSLFCWLQIRELDRRRAAREAAEREGRKDTP